MLGMGHGSSFVYAIVTRYAVDWVMKQAPKRWTKQRALYIAIGVLVVALSPAIYDHLSAQDTNYYQLLEIPVDCTPKQLKEAYRAASLKYHPDKLGDLSAEEEEAANRRFQRVREAYETLGHQSTKSVYDRFGPDMLERTSRPGADSGITQALVDMAVFYVSMIFVTFIMTLGRGSSLARKWSYTGLVVVLVAEVAVKFAEWNPARSVLASMTPHEKMAIVRIAFMSYMQGCHVLAAVTYVDVEAVMQAKLNQLAQDQARIVMELRAIRQLIGWQRTGGRGAAPGGAGSPAASATPTPTKSAPVPAALRNRKKRGGPGRVAAKKKSATAAGAPAAATAASAGAGGGAGAAGAPADGLAGLGAGPAAAPTTEAAAQQPTKIRINGLVWLVGIFLFYKYVIG